MLKLEIVTPEKRVLDAEVDSVTVPTSSGEAGIFPNHAPMISALKPGVLTYIQRGVPGKVALAGGFVEVSGGSVSVLADGADTAADIDTAAERIALQEASKNASGIMSVEDADASQYAIDAVQARIAVAEGK